MYCVCPVSFQRSTYRWVFNIVRLFNVQMHVTASEFCRDIHHVRKKGPTVSCLNLLKLQPKYCRSSFFRTRCIWWQCSSRLLLHSSFPDRTIATTFCLDLLPTSFSASFLFRTLLYGSSSESEDQSIIIIRPRSIHWLHVPERIWFKLTVLTYRTHPSKALHLATLPTVVFHRPRRQLGSQ